MWTGRSTARRGAGVGRAAEVSVFPVVLDVVALDQATCGSPELALSGCRAAGGNGTGTDLSVSTIVFTPVHEWATGGSSVDTGIILEVDEEGSCPFFVGGYSSIGGVSLWRWCCGISCATIGNCIVGLGVTVIVRVGVMVG